MVKHFLFAAVALSLFGCRHVSTTAGKGGNATLVIYPKHHGIGKNVQNLKVFVKYNSLDAPSNDMYDDSATGVKQDSILSCTFAGLKNGDYYLYGTGIDTAFHTDLKGGISYRIKDQTTQVVDLPISDE